MTTEKLPSGSYRYKKMYKGRIYAHTSPYRLNKVEAEQILTEKIKASDIGSVELKNRDVSVLECMKAYTEIKEPVLSPSTIADYARMPERFPSWFLDFRALDVDSLIMQKLINELTPDHSQKTLKNYVNFAKSSIRTITRTKQSIEVDFKPTLKKEPYIPTSEEVKRIVAESEGTIYELPIALACYGLRRSEIFAIEPSDLRGNLLTVNKSLVQDKNNEYIVKPYPKTADSVRQIAISDALCAKISRLNPKTQPFPNSVNRWLKKTCDKLGIERFKFHAFRHWVATELTQKGLPEADILKYCGWSKNADVMKKVYRHARIQSEQEKIQAVGSMLSDLSST